MRFYLVSHLSPKIIATLLVLVLVLDGIVIPLQFSLLKPFQPKKAYAASSNWSQTTFTGSDGTYTGTQPANTNADVSLDNVSSFSNSGGGKWKYRRPITINGSTGGAQTDYQVALILEFIITVALSAVGILGRAQGQLRRICRATTIMVLLPMVRLRLTADLAKL